MDCNFNEKISQFIDGELAEEESAQARQHLAECPSCQRAREDFLRLRREIKSIDFALDPASQKRAMDAILAQENIPIWRRKVALPLPAFALILIALIATAAWSVSMRLAKPAPASMPQAQKKIDDSATTGQSGLDISLYDKGERAVIYKERRPLAER